MLKIKDDVALEKLEKYGLYSVSDGWYEYCNSTAEEGVYVGYMYNEETIIFINKCDRIIYCCGTDLDILYKLITDGLVEIVENYSNATTFRTQNAGYAFMVEQKNKMVEEKKKKVKE